MESGLRVQVRPALAGDLEACLALLPAYLPIEPRVRKALPMIWSNLLFEPAFNTLVIEDLDASEENRVVALGMSIALNEEWQQRLRRAPPRYLAAQIYTGLLDGSFAAPGDTELGIMNAANEVAFAVLHYQQRPFARMNSDSIKLYCTWMGAFRLLHSGYRLRQLYMEGCGKMELDYIAGMGVQPYTQYAAQAGQPLGDPAYPEIYGLSSEQAAEMLPGTPVCDVFHFTPPIFGFTPSERRLLRLAIFDLPDDRIGAELRLSSNTIKKMWRSIHQRVASKLPALYGNMFLEDGENATRGPEKRRALIPYLRQNPEELRPYVMLRKPPMNRSRSIALQKTGAWRCNVT